MADENPILNNPFHASIVRMHDGVLLQGLLKKDKKAASFVIIGKADIRLNVGQASRLSSERASASGSSASPTRAG